MERSLKKSWKVMEFEELKRVRTLHNVNDFRNCGSCDLGYSIRHLSSIERVFHSNFSREGRH